MFGDDGEVGAVAGVTIDRRTGDTSLRDGFSSSSIAFTRLVPTA
jgi:hypothetical protein